jgi:hypothetical protein
LRRIKKLAVASVFIAGAFGLSGTSSAQRADACDPQPLVALYAYCGAHIPAERLPLTFRYNGAGAPSGVKSSKGADQTAKAISGAINAWNTHWPAVTMTCKPLCYAGATSDSFGYDGHNTISWDQPSKCGGNDTTTLALTCTWYDAGSTTRIREVDLILNPAFAWAFPSMMDPTVVAGDVAALAPADPLLPGWYDIQSVLTHEFGHAIGLRHFGSSTGAWPNDLRDTGAHIETMYSYYYPGTTNKRTLEAGDIAGELRVASDSLGDTGD